MLIATDPRLNPFVHYARMRASSPVCFDPEKKVWQVFAYRDVQTVLSDYGCFSSEFYENDPENQTLFTLDPPRHTQQRKRISKVFNSQMVANLEPRIDAIAHALLDRVIDSGRMDLIADYAEPLPIRVLVELLGVPQEDTHLFKRWTTDSLRFAEIAFSGGQPDSQVLQSRHELARYMEKLSEARKGAPCDDLISGLVTADDEGDGLTPMEIVGVCRALLVAGYETACNLIGNAMWSMFEHPETWARLQAQPELLPSAVEEALRYRSPGQFTGRLARKDVELAGHSIHTGQRVLVFSGSANRDPAVFPDPDRFDIGRAPNRHLAFGHGVHTCLGAMLARAEARSALRALLERLPGLKLDEGSVLEPLASRMIFGVARLPVRFASAARPVV